jgi:hypothetical protein
MAGIAEALKYLYQQFILRDIVAYVTPGSILAACVLRIALGSYVEVVNFIRGIPAIAYVPIYGVLFIIGLAIQNFEEFFGIIRDTKRPALHDIDDNVKKRFKCLRQFHHAAFATKGSPKEIDYVEELERTRERIEVKKYTSRNIALAVGIATVLVTVTKTLPALRHWPIAVVR